MRRRSLFRLVFGAAGLAPIMAFGVSPPPPPRQIVLQESPLAGFQYHAGGQYWGVLAVGDPLVLVREPDNPHDRRAVAVYWRDSKLGYVPRIDNAAVSQLMDRGEPLSARIVRLQTSRNPWRRIRLQITMLA